MRATGPIARRRQNRQTYLVVFLVQLFVLLRNLYFRAWQATRSHHKIFPQPSHRAAAKHLVACEVLADRSCAVLWIHQLLHSFDLFWIFGADRSYSKIKKIFLVVEKILPNLIGKIKNFQISRNLPKI